MAKTTPLPPGIDLIDTMPGRWSGMTASYLVRADDQFALVETGGQSFSTLIIDRLSALGVGEKELTHIVVTHAHPDHAGGVGSLARHYPDAMIWSHPGAIPFLIDPASSIPRFLEAYGADWLA